MATVGVGQSSPVGMEEARQTCPQMRHVKSALIHTIRDGNRSRFDLGTGDVWRRFVLLENDIIIIFACMQ